MKPPEGMLKPAGGAPKVPAQRTFNSMAALLAFTFGIGAAEVSKAEAQTAPAAKKIERVVETDKNAAAVEGQLKHLTTKNGVGVLAEIAKQYSVHYDQTALGSILPPWMANPRKGSGESAITDTRKYPTTAMWLSKSSPTGVPMLLGGVRVTVGDATFTLAPRTFTTKSSRLTSSSVPALDSVAKEGSLSFLKLPTTTIDGKANPFDKSMPLDEAPIASPTDDAVHPVSAVGWVHQKNEGKDEIRPGGFSSYALRLRGLPLAFDSVNDFFRQHGYVVPATMQKGKVLPPGTVVVTGKTDSQPGKVFGIISDVSDLIEAGKGATTRFYWILGPSGLAELAKAGIKMQVPEAAAGAEKALKEKAPPVVAAPKAKLLPVPPKAEPLRAPVIEKKAVVKAEPAKKGTEVTAEAASSTFIWPISGAKLLSMFGPQPDGSKNEGIKLAAPKGARVTAVQSGRVHYAGDGLKGYGNLVLIRHPDSWVSTYAHLDKMLREFDASIDSIASSRDVATTDGKTGEVERVKMVRLKSMSSGESELMLVERAGKQYITLRVGDEVKAGQTIGFVGDSGLPAGASPQLGFELRKGSIPVDPLKHLPR